MSVESVFESFLAEFGGSVLWGELVSFWVVVQFGDDEAVLAWIEEFSQRFDDVLGVEVALVRLWADLRAVS